LVGDYPTPVRDGVAEILHEFNQSGSNRSINQPTIKTSKSGFCLNVVVWPLSI